MTDYYKILGVTNNATIEQIKKAYRTKAKLFHPDINKSDNAHDQFLLITEAYEYLTQLKSQKKTVTNQKQQVDDLIEFWQQWQERERQKARERARQHAQMKYDAYLKSDLYRTTEAADTVMDFLITLVVLTFVIGIPILTYSKYGIAPSILSIIITLPTAPIWLRFLVRTFNKEAFLSFFGIHRANIKSKVSRFMLLLITNLIVMLSVAPKTLIPTSWTYAIYAILIIAAHIFTWNTASKYKKIMIRWAIAPGIFSLFFLINRAYTHTSYDESYWYTYTLSSFGDTFLTIDLENNPHQRYPGIRFFTNGQPLIYNSHITYTFATGLLGVKVVKERKITQ